MPAEGIGEVLGAALEAVGDVAVTGGRPRRGCRRVMFWLFVAMTVGLLVAGAYFGFG